MWGFFFVGCKVVGSFHKPWGNFFRRWLEQFSNYTRDARTSGSVKSYMQSEVHTKPKPHFFFGSSDPIQQTEPADLEFARLNPMRFQLLFECRKLHVQRHTFNISTEEGRTEVAFMLGCKSFSVGWLCVYRGNIKITLYILSHPSARSLARSLHTEYREHRKPHHSGPGIDDTFHIRCYNEIKKGTTHNKSISSAKSRGPEDQVKRGT